MAKIVQMSDSDGNVYPVSNSSGNGYCKMPDGTLIQWGATNTFSSGTHFSFPQAFNTSPSLFFSPIYNTNASIYCIYTASSIGTSGYDLYAFDTITKAWSTSTSLRCNWLAIGRWK